MDGYCVLLSVFKEKHIDKIIKPHAMYTPKRFQNPHFGLMDTFSLFMRDVECFAIKTPFPSGRTLWD